MKPKLWLRLAAAATSLLLLTLGLQAQITCPPDRTLAGIVGNTININTGLDANLNLLPFAVPDPRWIVTNNALPQMVAADRWNFPSGSSQWIAQIVDTTDYQVRFIFCTEACGDYLLNFRMMADNRACVLLDGMPVPSKWWPSLLPVSDCTFNPGDQSPFIPTAGYAIDHLVSLSAGEHILEIAVINEKTTITGINILGSIEAKSVNNCPCPPNRKLGLEVGSKININTGLDENLNVLTFGLLDPRWMVTTNTLPPMETVDRWNFPSLMSQWISHNVDTTRYQVQFTFCARKCGDYRLNFRLLADNSACVYLDGVLIPSSWWPNDVSIPDCNFNPNDQSPFIPTAGYMIDHLSFLSAGQHTLEIDVTNASGSLSGINILGEVEAITLKDCATAVHDAENQFSDFQVFPNPAQGQITLQWYNSAPRDIHMTDGMGRTLRSVDLPAEPLSQVEIPVNRLTPGTYFLLWQDNTGRIHSRRFMKI